jgi:hypothetical protein
MNESSVYVISAEFVDGSQGLYDVFATDEIDAIEQIEEANGAVADYEIFSVTNLREAA